MRRLLFEKDLYITPSSFNISHISPRSRHYMIESVRQGYGTFRIFFILARTVMRCEEDVRVDIYDKDAGT